MPTLEKQDPDVVVRAWTSSPGRRRCRSDVDVIARALKFGVFVKKHPSHAAPVVAQAQTLSPGCKRRRPSAEVWSVCEKTPLPRGTRRRPGTCAVACAHVLPPGRRRHRPSGYAFARAPTAVVARRRLRTTIGVVARASPVCARTSQGIKGPAFPSLFTLLPSEASWLGRALQQLLARTSRIGLWLSFLIVLFVYVNRIGAPLITFIFLITSVHITCSASCKNGEAEERNKGVGGMVYVATGWTYSEMCVLWKHNAV